VQYYPQMTQFGGGYFVALYRGSINATHANTDCTLFDVLRFVVLCVSTLLETKVKLWEVQRIF